MQANTMFRFGAVVALSLALIACVPTLKRAPHASNLAVEAIIPADQTIRYWGDDDAFLALHAKVKPGHDGVVDYLTLSGGGINGAYGAGFLVGWTAKGTRPEFEVVTGISVGAMIAPLAFIGPQYDERLRTVFSSITQQKGLNVNFVSALFGAPSILDNKIVLSAIRSLIDQQALDAIAAGHRDGRRLYVGTTNMDAQRPVIWDIGAIAISNIPNKLDLVHRIILASTAVPGVFPPILIDAQAGGQQISELHVDGGVTQQVLLMPAGPRSSYGNRKLFVIFNGVVDPQPATSTKLASLDLLQRAVPTMLKYLGRANLEQLANIARRSDMTFQLTAIPGDYPEAESLLGDKLWLQQLYDYGFGEGKAGVWHQSL
ncbi:patatin-like phospholipase family protein [Devosia sp. 2618]|uniref:patatin-like phospholipase family protein n=1 Tax=Devosia sp. 2618 TaxID=3156454 RepID=UPI003399BF05